MAGAETSPTQITLHLPEEIARSTAALLVFELGLVIFDFGLAVLGPASGHEADFSFADDGGVSVGPLLRLHVLGAGAE